MGKDFQIISKEAELKQKLKNASAQAKMTGDSRDKDKARIAQLEYELHQTKSK